MKDSSGIAVGDQNCGETHRIGISVDLKRLVVRHRSSNYGRKIWWSDAYGGKLRS
ncbi:hypothetical protein [Nostoc sp.]|uniref:hypothetical protein n=1 Tax=Nostoc sp. TaxID=1180 RepID=UPI002FFAB175